MTFTTLPLANGNGPIAEKILLKINGNGSLEASHWPEIIITIVIRDLIDEN